MAREGGRERYRDRGGSERVRERERRKGEEKEFTDEDTSC